MTSVWVPTPTVTVIDSSMYVLSTKGDQQRSTHGTDDGRHGDEAQAQAPDQVTRPDHQGRQLPRHTGPTRQIEGYTAGENHGQNQRGETATNRIAQLHLMRCGSVSHDP